MEDMLEENGYLYCLHGDAAIITGYQGPGGEIAMPSTLGGYEVIGIAPDAFRENKTLTSVTLPQGLIQIGARAFFRCASLTRVFFAENMVSIGDFAFANCTSLREVTLDEGLLVIGDGAFIYCSSLVSIAIPRGVEKIGLRPFAGCTALTLADFTIEKGMWGSEYPKDPTLDDIAEMRLEAVRQGEARRPFSYGELVCINIKEESRTVFYFSMLESSNLGLMPTAVWKMRKLAHRAAKLAFYLEQLKKQGFELQSHEQEELIECSIPVEVDDIDALIGVVTSHVCDADAESDRILSHGNYQDSDLLRWTSGRLQPK